MSKNRTTYLIVTPDKQTLLAEFRWTVSRGRDTYGYNICTLYIDGVKVSSCNGGGYDMQGTCLAEWLQEIAIEELKHLTTNYGSSTPDRKGYYGLSYRNSKTKKRQRRFSKDCTVSLDGGCGFSSIERIGNAIGYRFQYKG